MAITRNIRNLIAGSGLLALGIALGIAFAPDQADAQISSCPIGGCATATAQPLPDGCLTWGGETLCRPGETATPAEPTATEAVTCALSGCQIPFTIVDDNGETVKTMVITFADATP